MAETTRELVQRVYELKREGLNDSQISKQVGCSREQARRWYADQQKFDPYLDEVAIERAAEGDRAVYDALTVWEKEEFWKIVDRRIRTSEIVTEDHPTEGLAPIRYNAYLAKVTSSLGIDGNALGAMMRRSLAPKNRQGHKHHTKIGVDVVRAVRAKLKAGATQMATAREYGISKSQVWRISQGTTLPGV